MNHLRRLGNQISIPITPDEDGFTGRECPEPDCEGYFKIENGTGLKGEGLPCYCPYCGHSGGHEHFWTKDQIEFAKSIVARKFTNALYQDLKKLEFDHKPDGPFGIGISLKMEPGHQVPIHQYREKQLETEVVCSNCTLHYAVYGVFAFCPDCSQHNSLQILDKNLEVVKKMLDMVPIVENVLAEKLIESALGDCVSAVDGFGRELCHVYKEKAADQAKMEKISFQNLEGAKITIRDMFHVDLSAHLTADEWQSALRGFQKRHLFAHKMGVVDQDYIKKSGDTQAVIGRKVGLGVDEVRELVQIISKLARGLSIDVQEAGKNP